MPEELSPSEAARGLGRPRGRSSAGSRAGELPARRVGGRWRVAFDAIDALRPRVGALAEHGRAGRRGASRRAPFGRCSSPTAARSRIGSARTCDRSASATIVPATEGPGALDLLDVDAVVEAAGRRAPTRSIPVSGSSPRTPTSPRPSIAAGIRWVGPPPAAIRAMGDKAAARRLAASLGVPVLPGYDDADQSDDALVAAAARIGFPLLVKPAAGGGGKGMRIGPRPRIALPDALAGGRREATGGLRRRPADPRALRRGRAPRRDPGAVRRATAQASTSASATARSSAATRRCSRRRRRRRSTPALRERLGEAALTLARAVGYVSAGTCEFLLDDAASRRSSR